MSDVKKFAKETTRQARALRKRGPVARALVDEIDAAYFDTVKAQNAGEEERAHECAALGVDKLAQLRAL